MNLNDLPQSSSSGQPEIYRLLKIGDFANSSENVSDHSETMVNEAKPQAETENKPKNNLIDPIVNSIWSLTKPYRGLLIYPAIFIGSFLFFYTMMNFPSIAAQAQGLFAKPQDQQILGQDLEAYNKWIRGYFYSVSAKDLLTVSNDYDHDGLTNYDEFVMRTNPTLEDSDSDGTTDGVELINNTNPWGKGGITSAQDKLRDKIDLNMVSERITYSVAANRGQPVNNNANTDNFDLEKPGTLSIPRLNLQTPLVWSKDPSEFDADLKHGVIHYPGTAMPGNTGTMYVSGHSSDYLWNKNKYGNIFSKINFLKPGDDVFITVYGKDGKIYNYRYRVTGQNVYSADDQTQFIDNSSAKLNLSTCWPIGTSKNRMVISAELSNL